MSRYSLGKSVVVQRKAQLASGQSLLDYALLHIDDQDFDHSANFMAVSSQGTLYLLNLSASIILEELQNGLSIEQIVLHLVDLYDASKETLLQDAQATLATLTQRGIIEQQNGD